MGDKSARDQLLQTLDALRWSVTSLHWGGIEDWPTKTHSNSAQPEKCPTNGRSAAQQAESQDSARSLEAIQQELGECTRCRLHETRTRIVFGEGSPRARLVFVGEGPGYEEDQQGRPFVGKAGKLLDKMIKALGFERSSVYICNMVKCRPPNNRTPNSDEIEVCSPFLIKQIEAIRPAVICALGACAAQNLLGSADPISKIRKKVNSWRGIPFIATYHPAYLLRNSSQKAAAWQDLIEIHKTLEAHREKSRNL